MDPSFDLHGTYEARQCYLHWLVFIPYIKNNLRSFTYTCRFMNFIIGLILTKWTSDLKNSCRETGIEAITNSISTKRMGKKWQKWPFSHSSYAVLVGQLTR